VGVSGVEVSAVPSDSGAHIVHKQCAEDAKYT